MNTNDNKTERNALVARLRNEAYRKERVPTRTPMLTPASRWQHPAELHALLAQAAPPAADDLAHVGGAK